MEDIVICPHPHLFVSFMLVDDDIPSVSQEKFWRYFKWLFTIHTQSFQKLYNKMAWDNDWNTFLRLKVIDKGRHYSKNLIYFFLRQDPKFSPEYDRNYFDGFYKPEAWEGTGRRRDVVILGDRHSLENGNPLIHY